MFLCVLYRVRRFLGICRWSVERCLSLRSSIYRLLVSTVFRIHHNWGSLPRAARPEVSSNRCR